MHTKNFHIDRINVEDIEQIIELQRICYKQNLREDKEVFENLLSIFQEGAKKVINHQLIGYIFFHPYIYNKIKPLNQPLVLTGHENCMHLHDLSIDPYYRGMGLSKLLINSFNSATKLLGFKYQSLVAVQGSEKLWSKNGFLISGELNYGDELAFYMTKSL